MTRETITLSNGKTFPVVSRRRPEPVEKAKKRKFGNKPVTMLGRTFDSRAEWRRWADLEERRMKGEISDFVRQPKFVLAPSVQIAGEARKRPAVRYSADFAYTDTKTGERVVEDVKSPSSAMTEAFRLRQHLMQSVYGISVRVVK